MVEGAGVATGIRKMAHSPNRNRIRRHGHVAVSGPVIVVFVVAVIFCSPSRCSIVSRGQGHERNFRCSHRHNRGRN